MIRCIIISIILSSYPISWGLMKTHFGAASDAPGRRLSLDDARKNPFDDLSDLCVGVRVCGDRTLCHTRTRTRTHAATSNLFTTSTSPSALGHPFWRRCDLCRRVVLVRANGTLSGGVWRCGDDDGGGCGGGRSGRRTVRHMV